MKEFCTLELPDDQEFILNYRSTTDNGIAFIKLYERRSNLIRSFNINKYFKQNDEIDKLS